MPEKKILAIDDDPTSLYLVQVILSKAGYQVITASSGSGGVALAQREHPDLIILDIAMPDMDGPAVTRFLKMAPVTKDIPIIYLSALVTEKEEKISSSKDIPSLLAKPIYREKLLNEVRKFLTR